MSEHPPIGGPAAVYATYVARLLETARLPLGDEKQAQEAMAKSFDTVGISYVREFRLSARDIVDFLIDCGVDQIAVELKIKGAPRAICRQCERYCAHEAVGALVLATRRAMSLPPLLHGKPCVVASLGVGWL